MEKFVKLFDRIENLFMVLAFISITLMMLLISGDAIGRYVFHSPITGANEIVKTFLIVGVVFIGLSNTLKEKEHISVDIVVQKFPQKIRKILSLFVNLLGLLLFIFITYESWIVTYQAFVTNENYIGAFSFPMYAAYGLVPLGCLFIIVRLVINILVGLKNLGD
ncbi:TRAP transporter small permease [Neobacillus niacini]|uniref:TRAP transporter small permease n=1 Tax=Neobacillus niacini TaxID=86668 RepID=UPI003000102C